MELLRDPVWQSFGALIGAIALLLYVYVERDKISKLFSGISTQLRRIFYRLNERFPILLKGITTILNVLLLLSLGYFILWAPIFLYKAIIDASVIGTSSTFYGLVFVVWCLSVMTIHHKFTLDKLREQIDYLNRIPGIKELKANYDRQLFDALISQWKDFSAELVNKHGDSPFAIDLATCSPLEVQDEALIIRCPNKVVHKRMNRQPRSSTTGHDEEYQEWRVDKETIERIVRKRFHVREISYILENKS
jgi:hypothetical protein